MLHQLAIHLSRQGETVRVLAPRARGLKQGGGFPYPVDRYGHPSSKRFLVRQTLIHLLWIHLRHGFDVLHCHAAYPQAYVGATFKKWFGVPVAVRPHGSDIVPGGRMRRHPRVARRLKKGLASADAVIAQGKYLCEVIHDLGIAKDRIHIIHNGVDLKAFASGGGFHHPRPYILAVGSLIHRKGFDLLIEAYSRLPVFRPDLLIAGSGREDTHLRELCQRFSVEQQVRFLGTVQGAEKIGLFRSAEFFVCPSRKEPYANVILEALASGLPVVASAVDGNMEMVADGVNGRLFPSDNADALAAVLLEMITNPAQVGRLSAGAAESVKDHDWAIIAMKYRALYMNLLSKTTAAKRKPADGDMETEEVAQEGNRQ